MAKIALLPEVPEPDGTETVVILKDGVAKRASLVAIVTAAIAAPLAAASAALIAARDAAVGVINAARDAGSVTLGDVRDAAIAAIEALIVTAAAHAGAAAASATAAANTAAELAALAPPQTYPLPITGFEEIEIIVDDAGVARIVRDTGTAGARSWEDPQSAGVVRTPDLISNLGATSLEQMPSFYPVEAHIAPDSDGGFRVINGQLPEGTVLDFRDNPSDIVLIDYNPAATGSGVDRRLKASVRSPVAGATAHIEHIWERATDALSAGTWRRKTSFSSVLISTLLVGTAPGLRLSDAGYSGPGPVLAERSNGGVSYDDGGTLYNTSPFNFLGGGDIHKNNYPISFEVVIDGKSIDLSQPWRGTARELRILYVYKILRSRNPALSSAGNGFVHIHEEITVTARDQLVQRARAVFQEQATVSGYFPLECFDTWPEWIIRDFRRNTAGVRSIEEKLMLAGYNFSAWPAGDNVVPGVSRILLGNAAGVLAEMSVSAPITRLAANVPWGAPVVAINDFHQLKDDDPFKAYWNFAGPGQFDTGGGVMVGRAQAGDEWERTSQIKYFLPRS